MQWLRNAAVWDPIAGACTLVVSTVGWAVALTGAVSHMKRMFWKRGPTFYGVTLACGIGIGGLSADAYAKALDPWHDNEHESFVLQMTATGRAAASTDVVEVQDAITGDIYRVVKPRHYRGAGLLFINVSSGPSLKHG